VNSFVRRIREKRLSGVHVSVVVLVFRLTAPLVFRGALIRSSKCSRDEA
jgi:hypothetical protein